MPTLRQLEIFLAVIDHGSIRLAADHLDISQPSISKQIFALEKNVGALLLDRHRGSKAVPTKAGSDFVDLARQAIAVQKKMLLDQTSPNFPAKVVVMMRQHLYTEITPWIEEQKLPGRATELQFEIVNDDIDPFTLPQQFPDRIVLVRSPDLQSRKDVCAKLLAREKCSLYSSPTCADAHRPEEGINIGGAPRTLPILIPSSGLLTQWQIDHLRLAGFVDEQMVRVPPFISVILKQTLAGRGASVFMDNHVSPYLQRGELMALQNDIAALYLQFLCHPSLDWVLANEICTTIATLWSKTSRIDP